MERHHTRSYGGAATEHATANPSCWRGAAEMRVASDGVSYSYDDFVQHYGVNLGAGKCNMAAACTESRTFSDATEHAQRTIAIAETIPAATELRRPEAIAETICLRQQDAAALRAAEQARKPRRSLHDLARNTLNRFADALALHEASLDAEFPWQSYVACHNMASEIIGAGITRAVCVSFREERDHNQGHAPRTDFVFHRADGTCCCLHPGTKKRNDAKPLFSVPG